MRLISYRRVSTTQQGASGLGLEAQDHAVETYRRSVGGEVLKSYTEVETGKVDDRPELTKAITHARNARATLVVAKLDRLSRRMAFLSALMDGDVDFVCCDMPTANRLTLHVMAAMAEYEAKAISERTKAALAAYKARGGVLGSADPRCRNNMSAASIEKGWKLSREIRMRKALYPDLMPSMLTMKASGLSCRAIAEQLNADGYRTSTGGKWYDEMVRQVLRRASKRENVPGTPK